MKKTKKYNSIILLMAIMMSLSFAMPVTMQAAKAVKTKKVTVNACKDQVVMIKISKLAAKSKVKWKNGNAKILKPIAKKKSAKTATYKFSCKGLTAGTTITANIYNKKGKLTSRNIYKVVAADHKYTITENATCTKVGYKTCTVCKAKESIPTTAHSYAWVLNEKGITTDNTKLVTNALSDECMVSEYRPKEAYYFYNQRIYTGRGELRNTSSNVLSLFTMPQKTVKEGQKLISTLSVQLISYHDTDNYNAGGGTNSFLLTLDKKYPLTEGLPYDYTTQWTTTNPRGYENEHGVIYLNGSFGTKQVNETFEYEMPKGEKVGQIKYVVMQSFLGDGCENGIRNWLPYEWKATCH